MPGTADGSPNQVGRSLHPNRGACSTQPEPSIPPIPRAKARVRQAGCGMLCPRLLDLQLCGTSEHLRPEFREETATWS